jgi:hypothetical protein
MNLLKMLSKLAVFAVVAVAALTIVGKVHQRAAANGPAGGASPAAAEDKLSDAGFFLLSRDEAKNSQVTIMSVPNCPSVEAERARVLGSALHSAGIPCEMKSDITFTFTNPEDTARVNRRMENIANPLVLVRGWARGNPTLDQVIAEYRAGSGK